MTAYTTWTDFDDAAETPASVEVLQQEAGPSRTASAEELIGLGAPPEIVELFRQKEELEQKLKAFAGQPAGPVDAREAKRFPVKVHTKATRIEERRLRSRDEQLAQLNQRSLERARVERVREEQAWQLSLRELALARARREEQELRDLAHRRALEQLTLTKRAESLRLAEQEQARRELERGMAAANLAKLKKQRAAEDAERAASEREALLATWARERERAALATRLEHQHQRQTLERHEDTRRSACAARRATLNRSRAEVNADELAKKERRLHAHLQRSVLVRRAARKAERV